MLFRKNEKEIEKWLKQSNNSALLVSGVRQSGKTTSIRNVLKNNNCNYIEFNFLEQPDVVETLKANNGSDVKRTLALLSALTDKRMVKGETILFFDEVQEYKEIVTMIKFLVDEGSYRYILSGSLLGVELRDLRSAPVGYMREVQMYPMDLEEFLFAVSGAGEEYISILRESFVKLEPVDDIVHKRMMDHLFNYLIIGGMPKAVQNYIDNNDYEAVSDVHREIYPEYRRDFTKYESVDRKLKLIDAYDLIPAELNEQNKRFVISDLDKKLKFNSTYESFDWLIHAGVVIPVYNVSEPRIPLLISKQRNLFKLFLSDVGMLTTMYGNATRLSLLKKDGVVNYGAIFENYVAQELSAHKHAVYYFNSKKHGELDFVIENDNECLPLEIKSGKDYMRHSALNNVMNEENYHITRAYVLCNDNLHLKDDIVYMPVYMTMFI